MSNELNVFSFSRPMVLTAKKLVMVTSVLALTTACRTVVAVTVVSGSRMTQIMVVASTISLVQSPSVVALIASVQMCVIQVRRPRAFKKNFGELLGRFSPRVSNVLKSHIKHYNECFIRFPNTSKLVKKGKKIGCASLLFFRNHSSVFGSLMKHFS